MRWFRVLWMLVILAAALTASTVPHPPRLLFLCWVWYGAAAMIAVIVLYLRKPIPGAPFPGRPGYVTGQCHHAVAGPEWRAGYGVCERCGP